MQDFEKLGLFYLGREYDLAAQKPVDRPVLYDSRDLVTHAVCVGMTGSGKTGLCIGLIEEAAIDGVPVIAIDPKGDLSNLLLTFPRLGAEDFRPWVDEEEARRSGQTADAHAAQQAQAWKAGLAEWGQDGARIERLRAAAEFAVYTPGSRAGLPVSVLSSFAAPPPAARGDAELMADRAAATATSILSLAGASAEPRSREHSLMTSLFATAWQAGRSLDLASLIQQVQTPPFEKVGILDLESFFPAKDRFDLALKLNGILAAPGFDQWFDGEPLDPAALLRTADGKPRVSVFSIAHLDDAERMFFVSLLLNQIVGWMRGQTGTSSLRAIVFMDEIAGYFPPVANPPSKQPLLTLLKQARAFGVGVVLATQNPVDLDYKGLSNIGTWFIGRLQTDRDKTRMLDGLEGAAAGSLNRTEADRILSALAKRVFLLHNVHEPAPLVFQTRWTMSYLRGPVSREQIATLMGPRVPPSPSVPSDKSDTNAVVQPFRAAHREGVPPFKAASAEGRPVLPPGIEQYFIPDSPKGLDYGPDSPKGLDYGPDSPKGLDYGPDSPKGLDYGPDSPEGLDYGKTVGAAGRADVPAATYTPVVLGAARVTFTDPKLGIDESRDVLYSAPIADGAVAVDWQNAQRLDVAAAELRRDPASAEAAYEPLPAAAQQAKSYAAWQKSFSQWLSRTERIEILRNRETKLASAPGEEERDFKARVQDARRAARDEEVDAVRRKFGAKRDALEERVRKAQAAVGREEQQASDSKMQTALSFGAAAIGAMLGRKTFSTGTLGRATTAARGVGRSMREAGDVKRASENMAALQAQIAELDAIVTRETQQISERFEAPLDVERLPLAPRRGQVAVQFVALGWDPR